MATESGLQRDVISFGPFCLFPAERLIEKSGVPVHLGGRALDILVVLVEHAGKVVTKSELLARVWQGVSIEEVALRVHIAKLRKALGDGEDDARYVTNVPGRGYCFTGVYNRSLVSQQALPVEVNSSSSQSSLPHLRRAIGRDELIATLIRSVVEERFVTIVGPGGIGKTTVAIAVGHALLPAFGKAVRFIDLTLVQDAQLVPSVLASSLGLFVRSENLLPTIIAYLRDKHFLVILDCCEHVIGEVATLLDQVFQQAPDVHILTTSRETVGVDGEHVHRLAPLEIPPVESPLDATQALSYSAVQLFVERAAAATANFTLDETNVRVVGEICGRLDGIPLAIELAAGRMDAYGIGGISTLLDNQSPLSIRGRRTAQSRHQTLSATLDWSYDLLPENERSVLRRLSVFAGVFSLDAAHAISAGPGDHASISFDVIANLVAKSLVAAEFNATHARYRLLDITRAYARTKLIDSGEADATARRHADYYRDVLEKAEARSAARQVPEGLTVYSIHLGDVRSALSWAFSSSDTYDLGTALAAAAAPLLLELSLLTECRIWMEQAIVALRAVDRDTRREMMLQTAYGVSLISTTGNGSDALSALSRALAIAQGIGDARCQLQLHEILHVTHLRMRNFDEAFSTARCADAVAKTLTDTEAVPAAHCMMGLSFHFSGQHADARGYLELVAKSRPTAHLVNVRRSGVNFRINALCTLARILWLQGHCDAAFRAARDVVSEGQVGGNMMSYTMALALTIPVHLWRGDNAIAEEIINLLIDLARRHGLGPTLAVGQGWQGALATINGRAVDGVQLLGTSIQSLQDTNYRITATVFRGFCAAGLAANEDIDSALSSIDLAIDETAQDGDLAYMPELLRIKGSIEALSGDFQSGETSLLAALAEARRQSALSWELRVACDLAEIWRQRGRIDEALALLSPIYDRFAEGFDTRDLRTAALLLEALTCRSTTLANLRTIVQPLNPVRSAKHNTT
jgi:predicted ATPase/DNA-binding winged helix-turn-helix (wHTH) protein